MRPPAIGPPSAGRPPSAGTGTRRRLLTAAVASFVGSTRYARARGIASPPGGGHRRVALTRPGPMLPPVPAILLTVNGKPGEPDEISVLWTFVVSGDPPQVGVAAGDEHRAGPLLALHREFVLNVPVASLVHPFDLVDMSSSKVADKFALSGLHSGGGYRRQGAHRRRSAHPARVPGEPRPACTTRADGLPRRRRSHDCARRHLRRRRPSRRRSAGLVFRHDRGQRRVLYPGPEGGAHRPDRWPPRHPVLKP